MLLAVQLASICYVAACVEVLLIGNYRASVILLYVWKCCDWVMADHPSMDKTILHPSPKDIDRIEICVTLVYDFVLIVHNQNNIMSFNMHQLFLHLKDYNIYNNIICNRTTSD